MGNLQLVESGSAQQVREEPKRNLGCHTGHVGRKLETECPRGTVALEKRDSMRLAFRMTGAADADAAPAAIHAAAAAGADAGARGVQAHQEITDG